MKLGAIGYAERLTRTKTRTGTRTRLSGELNRNALIRFSRGLEAGVERNLSTMMNGFDRVGFLSNIRLVTHREYERSLEEIKHVLPIFKKHDVKLEHLSACLGTVFSGLSLDHAVEDAELLDAIKTVWKARKVVFFRGQQDMKRETHVKFANSFGPLVTHPFYPRHEDYPEITKLYRSKGSTGMENVFHSDVTFQRAPSKGSVLRALEVPDFGGDTVFCDMQAAYEALPEGIRAILSQLKALHTADNFQEAYKHTQSGDGASDEELKDMEKKFEGSFQSVHPVIVTNPTTGRKVPLINRAFTQKILDVDEDMSNRMITFLSFLATLPEFQCRFKWEDGSVAFWDNIACQHYAVYDYYPKARSLERVSIQGDIEAFDKMRSML